MHAVTSHLLLPAVSAIAAIVCIPAFAQSTAAVGTTQVAPGTGGGQLEEIIVTAEKRSERIEDVPMSITAVTGTMLASHGVVDTTDLAKLVTGFSYKTSSYGQPVLSIRGIGFDSRAYGNAPTVSVYLDQVPIPFSVLTRGTALDLERVEVLKGPQGTLFGENATGGAINYIAAKPSKDFQAGYDVSYGNFNDVNVSGFVSGALNDALTARFAVRRESADGWQYSMTRSGDTMGAKDFTQARLTLDFVATDKLRFEFSASGWVDKSQMQAAQYAGYSPGPIPVNSANAYAYAAMSTAPLAPNNDRAADWVLVSISVVTTPSSSPRYGRTTMWPTTSSSRRSPPTRMPISTSRKMAMERRFPTILCSRIWVCSPPSRKSCGWREIPVRYAG